MKEIKSFQTQIIVLFHHKILEKIVNFYYIDRCELWGFIRGINSGISHARCQFYPAGKCDGYVPCCVTVNTHTIVN